MLLVMPTCDKWGHTKIHTYVDTNRHGKSKAILGQLAACKACGQLVKAITDMGPLTGDCATTLDTTDTLDSISQETFRPQLNSTTEAQYS